MPRKSDTGRLRVRESFTLDPSTKERLRALGTAHGRSMSLELEFLVNRAFAEMQREAEEADE